MILLKDRKDGVKMYRWYNKTTYECYRSLWHGIKTVVTDAIREKRFRKVKMFRLGIERW